MVNPFGGKAAARTAQSQIDGHRVQREAASRDSEHANIDGVLPWVGLVGSRVGGGNRHDVLGSQPAYGVGVIVHRLAGSVQLVVA